MLSSLNYKINVRVLVFNILFLLLSAKALSQNDTIYTNDYGKISCVINDVQILNIRYQLPDNNLLYDISTLDVTKLKYRNGRIRLFQNKEKYPESVKNEFLESCLKAEYASYPYCLCTFLKIESKFSLNDFSNFSTTSSDCQNLLYKIAFGCASEVKNLELLKSLPVTDSEYSNIVLPMIVMETNKSCPKLIDTLTRLDNVTSNSKNSSITYNYTLVSISRDDINLSIYENAMRVSIQKNVEKNLSIKEFKMHNVKVSFTYYDKNNVYLFEIVPQL